MNHKSFNQLIALKFQPPFSCIAVKVPLKEFSTRVYERHMPCGELGQVRAWTTHMCCVVIGTERGVVTGAPLQSQESPSTSQN